MDLYAKIAALVVTVPTSMNKKRSWDELFSPSIALCMYLFSCLIILNRLVIITALFVFQQPFPSLPSEIFQQLVDHSCHTKQTSFLLFKSYKHAEKAAWHLQQAKTTHETQLRGKNFYLCGGDRLEALIRIPRTARTCACRKQLKKQKGKQTLCFHTWSYTDFSTF